MKIKPLILTTLLPAALFSQQGDTAYYHGPEAGIAVEHASFIIKTHMDLGEFIARVPSNDFRTIDTTTSDKGPKYVLSFVDEPLVFYEWMSMHITDATGENEGINTYQVRYCTGKSNNRTADAVYYVRGQFQEVFKEWWGVNLGFPKRLVYPHREQ
ncbi:MAG: hypothetical protein HWD92_05420 [Flavobacteriia bacterium]|nr:hypothetical protein [Flavobacteriia bacterium]